MSKKYHGVVNPEQHVSCVNSLEILLSRRREIGKNEAAIRKEKLVMNRLAL